MCFQLCKLVQHFCRESALPASLDLNSQIWIWIGWRGKMAAQKDIFGQSRKKAECVSKHMGGFLCSVQHKLSSLGFRICCLHSVLDFDLERQLSRQREETQTKPNNNQTKCKRLYEQLINKGFPHGNVTVKFTKSLASHYVRNLIQVENIF